MPSSVERSSSTSRSSSHRRHRSSHGSRSRSGRRRRRHRHNYRLNFKQAERNWIAAVFDLVVMAVLISALADQSWFRLHGGNCPAKSFGVLNFLFESFTPGKNIKRLRRLVLFDPSLLFTRVVRLYTRFSSISNEKM